MGLLMSVDNLADGGRALKVSVRDSPKEFEGRVEVIDQVD